MELNFVKWVDKGVIGEKKGKKYFIEDKHYSVNPSENTVYTEEFYLKEVDL